MIKRTIMPYPQKLNDTGARILIGEPSLGDFQVSFYGCSQTVQDKFKDILSAKAAVTEPYEGSYQIELRVDASDSHFADIAGSEAYYIHITEEKTLLCGSGNGGIYYAVLTFASLIEADSRGIYLPVLELLDYPHYRTRGMFIESRWNDLMTLSDWYEAVDYFASMKYNTLIISVYGCWSMQYDQRLSQYLYIPIQRYPQLKTPKHFKYYSPSTGSWVVKKDVLPTMYEEDFLGHIIRYGAERNVQVFPLFNSLGHNTLLPGILPDISAMDENGKATGFGMCLQNEKTYEVILGIYDEIIDRYLKPHHIRSIALGMDELQNSKGIDPADLLKVFSPFCKCPKCRNTAFPELLSDYVIRLLKHLKARGMENVYLYFDTLARHDLLTQDFADRLRQEDVYDITVIDWWNYSAYEKFITDSKGDRINDLFRGIIKPMAGYENWSNYMDSAPNVQICMEYADKFHLEGVIPYASYDRMYDINYRYIAECAWQWNTKGDYEEFSERYFAANFPHSYSDAKRSWELVSRKTRPYEYDLDLPGNSEYSYYTYSYLSDAHEWPRDHIAELFAKIRKNERRYMDHITDVYLRTGEALRFFEGSQAEVSRINTVFSDNCRNLHVICDELLTLSFLEQNYGKGLCDSAYCLKELDRLITSRKRMMMHAEQTRNHASLYHALRNMSIMLDYLISLREDFAAASEQTAEAFLPHSDRSRALFRFLR